MSYTMLWGDDFENTVEKTDCQYCHTACRGRAFRSAHPQQYGIVRGAQQTTFVTAGMAVPGRMDDFVCSDGDCFLPDGGLGKAQPYGFDRLRRPAPF